MPLPAIKNKLYGGSPRLYDALQDALRRAPSITVLCGAGISTSVGLKDFRSVDGLYHQKFHYQDTSLQGRDLFEIRTLRDPKLRRLMNKVMVDLRIQGRAARPSAFHGLIQAIHGSGRLVQCYTQNFDGLQTRNYPEMEDVVFEMHGSNRQLKCRECHNTPTQPAESFDQRLAEGEDVPCAFCTERGAQAVLNGMRRRQPGYLTPSILFNHESLEGRNGQDYHKMVETHGRRSKLFLVVGTSLLTSGVASVTRQIATSIRKNGGLVVFINRNPPATSWERYFDIYLETDIEPWAIDLKQEFITLNGTASNVAFGRSVDVVQTLIGVKQPQITSLIIDSVGKKIISRARKDNVSAATTSKPKKVPTDACLVLVSEEPTRVGHILENSLTSGSFHHFPLVGMQNPVSTSAYIQRRDPKFLVVVLHSDAVVVDATAIGQQTSARLSQAGWQSTYLIRQLYSVEPVVSPFDGDDKFHLMLVLVTGFVEVQSAEARLKYEADDIAELLALARRHVRRLSDFVLTRQAILICSGEQLSCSQETLALQFGMKGLFHCHEIFVSWNLRGFDVQAWADFAADIAQTTIRGNDDKVSDVVMSWMSNEAVFLLSDFVWFSIERPTLALIASPFDLRPFGRPLPDVNSTCDCDARHPRSRRKPKRWIIQHNCEDGMPVADAVVNIVCSWCDQTWSLPTEKLSGEIRMLGNSFSLVSKYFTGIRVGF